MNYSTPRARVLILIVLLLGFDLSCGKSDTNSPFPKIKGPPHQRLRWKAEKFFNDPKVLALCKAIEAKDTKEIDRLVRSGVDVNAKGQGDMTPLLWAFPMGEEVFKKMLEMGADPNVPFMETKFTSILGKGKSVMYASIALADGPVHDQYLYDANMDNYLKLVLAHGGNPNLEDLSGHTPIVYVRSSRTKMKEKIQMLIDAKADINHQDEQGKTPLMNGSMYSNDYIMYLLKAGADYRIADNNGWDFLIRLQDERDFREKEGHGPWNEWIGPAAQPIFDWLRNEGVNWEAAHEFLKSQEARQSLKNLSADYKHRPWLPQRPTLKQLDTKN